MTHLFIVAHLDDAELSCGGLIAKLISNGDHVKVVSLSHKYNGVDLSDEFERSMEELGVRSLRWCGAETRRFNAFENYIADVVYEQTYKFDYVYTHDYTDRHTDHHTVAKQVKRIYNGNLYTFLCPWNGAEVSNYFVELSEEHLKKKIKALACYESQSHRSYMQPDFIRAQAVYNGIKCGKKYAEAFRIEKLIA